MTPFIADQVSLYFYFMFYILWVISVGYLEQ